MEGPTESDESDRGTDEVADDGGDDETAADGDAVGGRRVVEAGAGVDVPLDEGGAASDPDGDAEALEGSEETPKRPDVASDGGGTDATDGDNEAVTFEDIAGEDTDDPAADGEDDDPSADEFEGGDAPVGRPADPENPTGEDGATEASPEGAPTTDDAGEVTDDGSTAPRREAADGDAGDDEAPAGGAGAEDVNVPPELRQLLSESEDADVERLLDEAADDSTADETAEESTAGETSPASGAGSNAVTEHRPDEPTDLAPTDAASENLRTTEEADDPATEAEPVSMRSEMSPALAERQAFLSLLIALGAGALFATVGNVLKLSRWQTIMLLVSAGIVVLLIATFVVFRAMLAAAERNDEPYRTAYTHPLFMFLFGVTTVVTALFVGYVSRLLT